MNINIIIAIIVDICVFDHYSPTVNFYCAYYFLDNLATCPLLASLATALFFSSANNSI